MNNVALVNILLKSVTVDGKVVGTCVNDNNETTEFVPNEIFVNGIFHFVTLLILRVLLSNTVNEPVIPIEPAAGVDTVICLLVDVG